jgi:hypothetical protein
MSSSGHNATKPSSSRSIIAVKRCAAFMIRVYTRDVEGLSPSRIVVGGSRNRRPVDGSSAVVIRLLLPNEPVAHACGSLLESCELCRQYGVKSGRKRVGDGDSAQRKPFLEIFRQKQATLGIR